MTPVVRRYEYQKLKRNDTSAGRVYIVDTMPLPSVTSILSATKDMAALDAWAAKVGPQAAERIKTEAAWVGTAMHLVVEHYLRELRLPPAEDWLQIKGYSMGYRLIEVFFPRVQEVWGTEIPLYYPERYAGTSDCIGLFDGVESIIDFKQSIRSKRREWIEDYFVQLAAYAQAHNKVHGTSIRQGIIMMVVQDGQTQEFKLAGNEFDSYIDKWNRRVDEFQKKTPGEGRA